MSVQVNFPNGGAFTLATNSMARVASENSSDGGLHTFVVGSPSHPDVPRDRLAKWMQERIERGHLGDFSAVEGIFSVFVVDCRDGVLHVLTDVLGLRPLYVRRKDNDVWLSTRVGTKWDAKAFSAAINMDAVRSWACFGYNATDGALWQGWRRLPGAVHLLVSRAGEQERAYHRLAFSARQAGADELTDRMIASVERSFSTQTAGLSSCKLSLSGGFDSRLLAGIGSRQRLPGFQVSVVNGSGNWRDRLANESTESRLAREACKRLGLPLNVIELGRDVWESFGEPFHLMADGFPITKQLIALIVGNGQSSPVINGFLGDSLMRGSWDCIDGKPEQSFKGGDLVDMMLRRHSQLPAYLLVDKPARLLTDWARSFLGKAMAPHYAAERAVFMLDLEMRQRFYMSNNFLQHLHQCEPVLPFATAELVDLKLSIGNGVLTLDSFRNGIRRRFPEIGDVPHSSDIRRSRPQRFRLASYTNRQWTRHALASLRRKNALALFNRRILVPRLLVGAVDARLEFVAETAMRFLMLERLAKHLGVEMDWER
ncbi:MAG: hypothetical protein IH627_05055 [Rubrivivax sp.]|nr:hypothetical protein [Rubrivivax sp.]